MHFKIEIEINQAERADIFHEISRTYQISAFAEFLAYLQA